MASNRGLLGRVASLAGVAACVAVALSAVGCGGGGGYAAKPMVLVEYLYVDRGLVPAFPTGVRALPRNAQIVFQFSELVDPYSVNEQTIQIRYGTAFQSVPKGSFQVDGSRVIFDPTVTTQGTPNPLGFEPLVQYTVDLPSEGIANDVVRNLDNDPLLNSFFTTFTTADTFLRELVPPQVVRAYFLPAQDPLTEEVPANAILALEYSEAMDPASIVQALGPTVALSDTIDIRYADLPDPNVNATNNVENIPISGQFNYAPDFKTFYFTPTFGWGNAKLVFFVQVFQGLQDLSGNLLVNPRSFGPYVCDGTGATVGKFLTESFDNATDRDPLTTADWGISSAGTLQGMPISNNIAYVLCGSFAQQYNGQYAAIADPLIGAAINQYVTNIQPPTNQGRRVMWAFTDAEVPFEGSITAIAWGPDSNATFAAQYPEVILRLGFQRTNTLSLAGTFSGNFLGSPLVAYRGPYSVQQRANVGDYGPPPAPALSNTTPYLQLNPLFSDTVLVPSPGFVDWPTPTSFFDWDVGDLTTISDRVLVLDASVQEGDTWQQLRGWFAVTFPNSGVLISGFPNRRMRATYEEDTPNPPANFAGGVLNPEPSLTDTAFTITRRTSVAQSRFYTPGASDPAGNTYLPPYSDPSKRTFGVKTDYLDPILQPQIQSGGASLLVEFQGAMKLMQTSNRTAIDTLFPSTGFTTDIDDCDGYPNFRWRMTLTGNLISNQVPRLSSISVPLLALP